MHGFNITEKRQLAVVLAGMVLFLVVAFAISKRLTETSPETTRFAVAHPVTIAPHKALYSMDLISAQTGSSVTDIRGRMFFKWEDACDAWATDHRFAMEYAYADRPSLAATSDFVAWESKDGRRFQFSSESTENGEVSEVLRGSAERRDEGGSAVFTQPDGLGYALPEGFFFPSEHTLELIARAIAGENIFHAVMFDGTDQEGPVEVNAVIGASSLPPPSGAAIDAGLLAARAWRVRLAFFSRHAEEETPLYEMTIVLHENGVVSYILVDYKTFSVEQRLQALEKLPPGNCEG